MAENEYIRRVDIEKAITAIRDLYREEKNFNAVSAVDNVAGEIRECVKNVLQIGGINQQLRICQKRNVPNFPI